MTANRQIVLAELPGGDHLGPQHFRLNVGEAEIDRCLAELEGDAPTRLSALQAALGCGTSCGSCLPELNRMVIGQAIPAVVPELSA